MDKVTRAEEKDKFTVKNRKMHKITRQRNIAKTRQGREQYIITTRSKGNYRDNRTATRRYYMSLRDVEQR